MAAINAAKFGAGLAVSSSISVFVLVSHHHAPKSKAPPGKRGFESLAVKRGDVLLPSQTYKGAES